MQNNDWQNYISKQWPIAKDEQDALLKITTLEIWTKINEGRTKIIEIHEIIDFMVSSGYTNQIINDKNYWWVGDSEF
ncbi:MAG: hypothetical protein GC181_12095 [Bacteroidetes bacterium]|nr:hypothetical protein [Bacteroidota bacterium]